MTDLPPNPSRPKKTRRLQRPRQDLLNLIFQKGIAFLFRHQNHLIITKDSAGYYRKISFEALRFFDKKKATIVTMEQRDRFEKDGLIVEVVPAHEFLMNHRF